MASSVEYVPLWENYIQHDPQDPFCCCQPCLDRKIAVYPWGVSEYPEGVDIRLESITEYEKVFLTLEPFPLPPPTNHPDDIRRGLTAVAEIAVWDWQLEHNHIFQLMKAGLDEPIWPLVFSVFNSDTHISSIMPTLRHAATAAQPQWGDRECEDDMTYALLIVARGYFERKLSYL